MTANEADVRFFPSDPAGSGRWEFYAVTAEKAGLCRCWVHLLDAAVAVSPDMPSPEAAQAWRGDALSSLAAACRYALSVIGDPPPEAHGTTPSRDLVCKHYSTPHLINVLKGARKNET